MNATAQLERDDAVVRDLYTSESGRLRHFVRGVIKSGEGADDIVQEAFSRLLSTIQDGHIANPKAYVYTSARNIAIDNLRGRTRRGAYELDGVDSDDIPDGLDSERAIDARLTLAKLEGAVAHLSPKSRSLFVRRKLLGESFREISSETQIATSTIEKHVSRCVQACRHLQG